MEKALPKTYPTRTDAELDRGFLEANGIKSIVSADDEGGINPWLLNATGFVRIIVAKKDYKKACQLLKILRKENN